MTSSSDMKSGWGRKVVGVWKIVGDESSRGWKEVGNCHSSLLTIPFKLPVALKCRAPKNVWCGEIDTGLPPRVKTIVKRNNCLNLIQNTHFNFALIVSLTTLFKLFNFELEFKAMVNQSSNALSIL